MKVLSFFQELLRKPQAWLLLLLVGPWWASPAAARSFPEVDPFGDRCWARDAATAGQSVWLLCEDASVRVSLDGGVTWTSRPGFQLLPGQQARALALVDEYTALVAGDYGLLARTEDAGESWDRVHPASSSHLHGLFALGGEAWAAGTQGTILHSRDGGRTWTFQFSGTNATLESVWFLDARKGFAAGWLGTLLCTTDGGESWRQVLLPGVYASLNSIAFRDHQNGWIAGAPSILLRTRDGGATWERQPVPGGGWLSKVRFGPDGSGCYIAGSDLLASDDGGESWRLLALPESAFVSALAAGPTGLWVATPMSLYASRDGGQQWQSYSLAGRTGLREHLEYR
jgi:photosystem II stability/assembly factor-like uncharacterized protein